MAVFSSGCIFENMYSLTLYGIASLIRLNLAYLQTLTHHKVFNAFAAINNNNELK